MRSAPAPAPAPTTTAMPRLSAALLAAGLFAVTFAVNLSAPLLPAYVGERGGGAGAATLAFAAYVGGLTPTLLLLGGLSDRIGRRAPLAAALLLAGGATLLLTAWPGWGTLTLARALLGVAAGLVTTSGAAFMVEILGEARSRGAAWLVAAATSLGFGGGALATGLSLMIEGESFAPASYRAMILAAPVLALACLALPRTPRAAPPPPLLRLPAFPPGGAGFGLAMALSWAATGMTIAVIPLALDRHGLAGWSGFVVFLALFVGFLCQPLARRMQAARALRLGMTLLPLGGAALLAGAWAASIPLVLLGAAGISASSYGFTYLAALSDLAARAPELRARAAAGLFVQAYAGFSLPVIAAGALADRLGLVPAMAVFFAALLAALAAIAPRFPRPRRRAGAPEPASGR